MFDGIPEAGMGLVHWPLLDGEFLSWPAAVRMAKVLPGPRHPAVGRWR